MDRHRSTYFYGSFQSPHSDKQTEILEQELAQSRILATLSHTVYLLPEFGPRKTKHPDAIVDGIIMEFKTVSGNERKIKEKYLRRRNDADKAAWVIFSYGKIQARLW